MKSIRQNQEIVGSNYIGKFVRGKSKIKYDYGQEACPDLRSGFYSSIPFSEENVRSINPSNKEILHGRKKVGPSREMLGVYDGTEENKIFKSLDEIKGPFFQCDSPMIEKAILGKEKVYFAYINNKLVTYSVFNDKGKKAIDIYLVQKVDFPVNRDILKKYAMRVIEGSNFYEDLTKRKNIVDVFYFTVRKSSEELASAA